MSQVDADRWWPRLLPLLAGTVAVGSDAWIVAGFLPALATRMGVSTATAGLSVTVFAIGYAVGAPVLAAATSAMRPRRVIAWALVLLGAANALCAVSNGFGLFLVGRVLASLAACVVTPAAGVLASRVAGASHRGRALALVIAGLTIATAVGVPLGSLVARSLSWRGALAGVAVLSWLAAALIRATAPDPEPGPRQRLRDRLAPLGRPRVLAVVALTVLGMTAAYIPYAYVARLVPAGAGGGALVAVLFAYGVGAVAGSLGSGALTDAVGSRRTLVVCYFLMAAANGLMALGLPVVGLVVVAVMWGAASWMQTPPQQDRLLRIAPDHGPVTIGTNASALYAGIAVGNSVGALLLSHGTRTMCLAAAGVALAALAWNLLLPTPPRR